MTSADDENEGDGFQPVDDDLEYLPPATVPVQRPQSSPFQYVHTIATDRETYARQRTAYQAHKRRQYRISVILFVLTLCSTFLVSSGYVPFRWLATKVSPGYVQDEEARILENALATGEAPQSLEAELWSSVLSGLMYAIPLMTILFCHEMGHYLQSVRHRVPASFPYFIPLPLPPLGTMGAVILQGRGVATRRQMFDIAVSGPIAGLVITMPVLLLGIYQSGYEHVISSRGLEFGEPLLLQWVIHWIHGAGQPGQSFIITNLGLAGWVGVFITAMNLLPVGQLDGGHILYTLIGRKAHTVAFLVIAAGIAMMTIMETYTFSLLLILLMVTGLRHPPTANDSEPLGTGRTIIGWLTLSFLIIGFTPTPIAESGQRDRVGPAEQAEPVAAEYEAECDKSATSAGVPAQTCRSVLTIRLAKVPASCRLTRHRIHSGGVDLSIIIESHGSIDPASVVRRLAGYSIRNALLNHRPSPVFARLWRAKTGEGPWAQGLVVVADQSCFHRHRAGRRA